jgi:hypothetical protein
MTSKHEILACAKPRLPKPCAAGRRSGEGRNLDIQISDYFDNLLGCVPG